MEGEWLGGEEKVGATSREVEGEETGWNVLCKRQIIFKKKRENPP